jgi:prepilin-type N-terminal cleavage/methylation domain-containing protein
MRHGFTLPEMLLLLALVSLALGIALPRIGALRDSLSVQQAAQQVAGAHRRARMLAIARGQPTALTVGVDSLGIRLGAGAVDFWGSRGPAALGVTLAGPIRRMTFSPLGYTTGLSNASFRLIRGQASLTVVVSRLGRIRMTRP